MLSSHLMSKAALGVAGIATALLVGCASPPNNDRTEMLEAEDGFPALSSNWYGGGHFIEPNAVLSLHEGYSKDQVRQLIGNPHFSEGFFAVREWNYVFNFYTGEGNNYITCQYQVRFDSDMTLASTRWRDAQCPALLVPLDVEQNAAEDNVMLPADLLFAFDSATLTLEGRRGLDSLAQTLLRDFSAQTILIRGYTDRLGSQEYNQKLSEQRASAVKTYLASRGIPSEAIETVGLRERDPVVECPGSHATQALKQCLQPNRRVEIHLQ